MYTHGGPWPDIRFLTKWGMWMTWLCFLTGLFNLDPPVQGDKALLKSHKYSPFRAWKWHMLLFECALTFELMICSVYWPLLFKDTWFDYVKINRKISMAMDHSVPLFLLLIEYFLANTAFLKKHVYAVCFLILLYLPINLYYSIIGKPPYAIMDWASLTGFILPIAFAGGFILVFLSLEFLTRIKLGWLSGLRNR